MVLSNGDAFRFVAATNGPTFGAFTILMFRVACKLSSSLAINWRYAEVIVTFAGTPRWNRRPTVLLAPRTSGCGLAGSPRSMGWPVACDASSAATAIGFAFGTKPTLSMPSHSQWQEIAFGSPGGPVTGLPT